MNKIEIADSCCGGSRPGHPSKFSHLRIQTERLLHWLAGINTQTFSVAETMIFRNLPSGIKIEQATGEELGRATKAAIESHNEHWEEIVRFVFSSLKAQDGEKGQAVIRSVISVISAKALPNFIRIAVSPPIARIDYCEHCRNSRAGKGGGNLEGRCIGCLLLRRCDQ